MPDGRPRRRRGGGNDNGEGGGDKRHGRAEGAAACACSVMPQTLNLNVVSALRSPLYAQHQKRSQLEKAHTLDGLEMCLFGASLC